MIDIHCHFLPGIDDGPETMAEAMDLARMAWEGGITHSVLTPHIHPGRWENTARSIKEAVDIFRIELKANAIPLHVSFAAEVRLTDSLFGQLESGKIPFLGRLDGYSLLLLEFPHGHIIPGSDQLVNWLLARKIRPIIAHPERNKAVMHNMQVLMPFIELGCLLQVTAGSLTGGFGRKAEGIALSLLENDQINFVATDAHNDSARPPLMSQAFDLVVSKKGSAKARLLFEMNQRAILELEPETQS